MMESVIGLLESREAAQRVRSALIEAGCDKNSVVLFGAEAGWPRNWPIAASRCNGPASTPEQSCGVASWSLRRPRRLTRLSR